MRTCRFCGLSLRLRAFRNRSSIPIKPRDLEKGFVEAVARPVAGNQALSEEEYAHNVRGRRPGEDRPIRLSTCSKVGPVPSIEHFGRRWGQPLSEWCRQP